MNDRFIRELLKLCDRWMGQAKSSEARKLVAELKATTIAYDRQAWRREGPRVEALDITADTVVFHLKDGRIVSQPLGDFPRLRDATLAQRANFRIVCNGAGVHWADIDEDISVRGMLSFGEPRAWSKRDVPPESSSAAGLICAHCGSPAICIGQYEDHSELLPACDECCAHGCEDGQCWPLAEVAESWQQEWTRLVEANDELEDPVVLVTSAEHVIALERAKTARAQAERDAVGKTLATFVPCQACGWSHPRAPTSDEELPIVRGALDAQAEAEQRTAQSSAPRFMWERVAESELQEWVGKLGDMEIAILPHDDVWLVYIVRGGDEFANFEIDYPEPRWGRYVSDAEVQRLQLQCEAIARVLTDPELTTSTGAEYIRPVRCSWEKLTQAHGDPEWKAHLDGLTLHVSVECEWTWEWNVWCGDEQVAGGYVDASDAPEVALDDWDYQNVEWAQQRCEAVARGLLTDRKPSLGSEVR